jgi:hypothetical protein
MKIVPASPFGVLCLCGALLAPCVSGVLRRTRNLARPADALAVPDNTGYDPVTVLCSKGKKVQGWCKDWISCIKAGAQPDQDAAAVLKAWKPAECKEICGVFPATTGLEGTNLMQAHGSAAGTANTSLAAQRLFGASDKKGCVDTCGSFKEKLSTCVAKILFEPGMVANMGLPSGDPKPKGPAYCTEKGTPCVPDLPIRHSKCVNEKAKATWRGDKLDPMVEKSCKMVANDMDHCEDCPSNDVAGQSEYAAFAGGCMTQLNLYWQATHPEAGEFALPGAEGCQVH